MLAEAHGLMGSTLELRDAGPYVLQASIAALHSEARSTDTTDWDLVVKLYDLFLRRDPSPVVALNRAVAVAMRDGPEAGLTAIKAVVEQQNLASYHLAHAAMADMHRRLADTDGARLAYLRAIELTDQPAERRFLQKRLAALT
jgi:RNA polymerase sigma-70 factor, ECF subfamily